jgi:hypothetical protein
LEVFDDLRDLGEQPRQNREDAEQSRKEGERCRNADGKGRGDEGKKVVLWLAVRGQLNRHVHSIGINALETTAGHDDAFIGTSEMRGMTRTRETLVCRMSECKEDK